MQPRRHFGLVFIGLGRQPEHMRRAGRLQLGEQIAKRTGLRRAAARARDHVPVIHQRNLAGLAGARITEHDDAAGQV